MGNSSCINSKAIDKENNLQISLNSMPPTISNQDKSNLNIKNIDSFKSYSTIKLLEQKNENSESGGEFSDFMDEKENSNSSKKSLKKVQMKAENMIQGSQNMFQKNKGLCNNLQKLNEDFQIDLIKEAQFPDFDFYLNKAQILFNKPFEFDDKKTVFFKNDMETIFQSQIQDGKLYGMSRILWKDKTFFQGFMQFNLPNGFGILKMDQIVFVGFFKQGEWKEDMPHGQGKEFLENGDFYQGTFDNGEKTGEGKVIFKDGSIYKGNFKNGTFHGKGTLKNADMKYVGDWKFNKKHGRGTYFFKSGAKYQGEYKDDLKDGVGKYTFENGKQLIGIWQSGNLIKTV